MNPTWVNVASPLGVAFIGLVGIVVGASLGRWAEATNRRRDHYAAAVEALVAWIEFPYRIRRRVSDSQEELSRLAGLGHDLQERLLRHATWISAEHAGLGDHYNTTLRRVKDEIGAASKEAWTTPPIARAEHMNLGPWGPSESCQPSIDDLQHAISWRFGFRRAANVMLRLVGRDRCRARRHTNDTHE